MQKTLLYKIWEKSCQDKISRQCLVGASNENGAGSPPLAMCFLGMKYSLRTFDPVSSKDPDAPTVPCEKKFQQLVKQPKES